MKSKLIALVLASAVAAFAQGRGGGHAGGPPAGVGGGMGAGMGHDMGPSTGRGAGSQGPGSMGQSQTQQPLKQAQIDGGSWKMLQQKTGMTSDQLQQLYQSSGAKNYGQFVSAIVVSKNLGLDTNTLLTDLKTMSLGKALQSMGVSSSNAKAAIKQANRQIKDANKNQ